MSSILFGALSKHLAMFFKNMDSKNMSTSFFKGDVELRDLEFREDVLQELLYLPPTIRVLSARCTELKANVPWTKLSTQPIVLRLGRVDVELGEPLEVTPVIPTGVMDTEEVAPGAKPNYKRADKWLDGMTMEMDTLAVTIRCRPPSPHSPVPPALRIVLSNALFRATSAGFGPIADLTLSRTLSADGFEVLFFKLLTADTLQISCVAPPTAEPVPITTWVVDGLSVRLAIKRHLVTARQTSEVSVIFPDLSFELMSSDWVLLDGFLDAMRAALARPVVDAGSAPRGPGVGASVGTGAAGTANGASAASATGATAAAAAASAEGADAVDKWSRFKSRLAWPKMSLDFGSGSSDKSGAGRAAEPEDDDDVANASMRRASTLDLHENSIHVRLPSATVRLADNSRDWFVPLPIALLQVTTLTFDYFSKVVSETVPRSKRGASLLQFQVGGISVEQAQLEPDTHKDYTTLLRSWHTPDRASRRRPDGSLVAPEAIVQLPRLGELIRLLTCSPAALDSSGPIVEGQIWYIPIVPKSGARATPSGVPPPTSTEVLVHAQPINIVYDALQWERIDAFVSAGAPARAAAAAARANPASAGAAAAATTATTTAVPIGAPRSGHLAAPPMHLFVFGAGLSVTLPPFAGYTGPRNLAAQVWHAHLERLTIESAAVADITREKMPRAFEEDLFACERAHVFPATPHDAPLDISGAASASTVCHVASGTVRLDMCASHGALPQPVLYPIAIHGDVFPRDESARADLIVGLYTAVVWTDSLELLLTRPQFEYLTVVMTERIERPLARAAAKDAAARAAAAGVVALASETDGASGKPAPADTGMFAGSYRGGGPVVIAGFACDAVRLRLVDVPMSGPVRSSWLDEVAATVGVSVDDARTCETEPDDGARAADAALAGDANAAMPSSEMPCDDTSTSADLSATAVSRTGGGALAGALAVAGPATSASAVATGDIVLEFTLPLALIDISFVGQLSRATRTLVKASTRTVWLAASGADKSCAPAPVRDAPHVLLRYCTHANRLVARLRDIDISSHTNDWTRALGFTAMPPHIQDEWAAMETNKIRTDIAVEVMRCTVTTALEGEGGTLYFPLWIPYMGLTIAETPKGNKISLAELKPYTAEPSPTVEALVDELAASRETAKTAVDAALELDRRLDESERQCGDLAERVAMFELERKVLLKRIAALSGQLEAANAAASRRVTALAATRQTRSGSQRGAADGAAVADAAAPAAVASVVGVGAPSERSAAAATLE